MERKAWSVDRKARSMDMKGELLDRKGGIMDRKEESWIGKINYYRKWEIMIKKEELLRGKKENR